MRRDEPGIKQTRGGFASNSSAREHIARDLARDLTELLSSGATIEIRREDGTTERHEPVRPATSPCSCAPTATRPASGTRSRRPGSPRSSTARAACSATPPARDWLALLEALERPTSSQRARAAALTPFLGWTAARIAEAGEEDWEQLHRRLHQWARILRTTGVAALTEAMTLVEGLPERVLREADGERRMTDLRHRRRSCCTPRPAPSRWARPR